VVVIAMTEDALESENTRFYGNLKAQKSATGEVAVGQLKKVAKS
jgi:hypothetical protein